MVAESTEILRPMLKLGVLARLRRGDSPQRSRVALAKRPARGRQDDAVHALRPGAAVFRQALENGRVLAINGQQRAAMVLHGLHKQGTANHQGLFIGQEQPFARPRSRQARGQACSADNRAHDGIDFCMRCYRFKCIWRLQYLGFKVVLL